MSIPRCLVIPHLRYHTVISHLTVFLCGTEREVQHEAAARVPADCAAASRRGVGGCCDVPLHVGLHLESGEWHPGLGLRQALLHRCEV